MIKAQTKGVLLGQPNPTNRPTFYPAYQNLHVFSKKKKSNETRNPTSPIHPYVGKSITGEEEKL